MPFRFLTFRFLTFRFRHCEQREHSASISTFREHSDILYSEFSLLRDSVLRELDHSGDSGEFSRYFKVSQFALASRVVVCLVYQFILSLLVSQVSQFSFSVCIKVFRLYEAISNLGFCVLCPVILGILCICCILCACS